MTDKTQLCVFHSDGSNIKDAKRLLEEAIAHEFESVVVIGYKKGEVKVNASSTKDNIYVLGAIEVAKNYLLNNWD